MASSTIAPFGHGSIENIARIIGELYTGPELTRMLASLGMPDTLGASATKWKRLAASMGEKQLSQDTVHLRDSDSHAQVATFRAVV